MSMERIHRLRVAWFWSLLLCACVGGFLLTGCGGDDKTTSAATAPNEPVTPDAPVTPGIIRGQVIRGDTQQPQQGLTVVVDATQQKTTTTDANGHFEVKDLEVTAGGAGYLVTIKDERQVGAEANQIRAEAERLATVQFRQGLTLTVALDNAPIVADVGVVALNLRGSVNVLVTLADGTPVPDDAKLTVAAFSAALNGTCAIGAQVLAAPTPATIPTTATTGAGGRATLDALDSCRNYTIVVPAQVVSGVQQAGNAVSDVEIIQGEAQVVIRLVPAIPDTPLAVVASNMTLPPGAPFTTAGGGA